MLPAEARERYGVSVSHAADGERVVADDGTELVVFVSPLNDTRHVVHADVVDYDGLTEHPVATGLAGFLALVAALMVPLAGALVGAGFVTGTLPTAGVVLAGVVGAFWLANVVLYRTFVHDWVFRLLEWNSNKSLIMAKRGGQA